jgi:hypothetical protein
MFEKYKKFLRSDAIQTVIENHGLTGRSPLKGLKRSISGGFNPFNGFSTLSQEFHSRAD